MQLKVTNLKLCITGGGRGVGDKPMSYKPGVAGSIAGFS